MAKLIGLDLGTTNTSIILNGKGIILREPSAVAFDIKSGDIIAAGIGAKKMVEKAPSDKEAVTPLKSGTISNFDDTVEMLSAFFYRAGFKGLYAHPKVAIGIPWGITEVEKNAFENACMNSGAKEISMSVTEPMAAALGADINLLSIKSNLIVDIGGGNTQMAVISYKGIVCANAVRKGGDDIDKAIISYIRNTYSILIGKITAELVKKSIGSADVLYDRGEFDIIGKSVITGQATRAKIKSVELRAPIHEVLFEICEKIRSTIEGVAPDIASDIYDTGLYLVGGSALISGIDKFIEKQTGIMVHIPKNPIDCVVNGLGKAMQSKGELTEIISNSSLMSTDIDFIS